MQVFPSHRIARLIRPLGVLALISLFALQSFAQPSSTWVKLKTGKKPSPRNGHVMVYDPVSQQTLMFGGWDGSTYLADTWMFDGKKWHPITTSNAPPARTAASAAFDAKLKQVVLFGGFNGNYLGDTWLWDGSTMTWTQASPSHQVDPVTGPMLYPDPISGRVDQFGGYDGMFYQLTPWRWNKGDWHKCCDPKHVPGARSAAVFGTNPALKQTVMFGGLADVNPVNTWTFDGHSWTQQLPSNQPSWRFFSGTAYDPRFGGVLAFGGAAGGQDDVNETWLWDGSNWSQLSPQQSPVPREQLGMVFDELHQQTVIFAGSDGNRLLNDTWVLQTQ